MGKELFPRSQVIGRFGQERGAKPLEVSHEAGESEHSSVYGQPPCDEASPLLPWTEYWSLGSGTSLGRWAALFTGKVRVFQRDCRPYPWPTDLALPAAPTTQLPLTWPLRCARFHSPLSVCVTVGQLPSAHLSPGFWLFPHPILLLLLGRKTGTWFIPQAQGDRGRSHPVIQETTKLVGKP